MLFGNICWYQYGKYEGEGEGEEKRERAIEIKTATEMVSHSQYFGALLFCMSLFLAFALNTEKLVKVH